MPIKNLSPHNIVIKCFRNKRLEDVPTLYQAVEFFLDELLKRCTIAYKLNVLVTLRNGVLIDRDDGSQNVGLVEETEIKGETWYKIDLSNDLSFLELLSTLAHECVHMVQFATGRLKSGDSWVWDGVDYGDAYEGDGVDKDLPWEYDAYTKESELCKKFIKHYFSNPQ